MEFGGSGLSRMTHVKLMVLPMPTKTSLPPRTVVLGSKTIPTKIENRIKYTVYVVLFSLYTCTVARLGDGIDGQPRMTF